MAQESDQDTEKENPMSGFVPRLRVSPKQVGPLPFIVHSHLRWDFVWQRPQQIFSRVAKTHPVLFVEEPIAHQKQARLEISEPFPNVIRAVPWLKDVPHNTADIHYKQALSLLRRALREHPMLAHRFDTPIQWFYSPMSAPCMLGKLDAVRVVYDCMDELANFRFAPPDIGERERRLLANADLVFTGGYQLYQAKSRYHSNVHFYGCGVDAAHFRRARQHNTEIPAELARLPRPVFGYFGVIDERLDYELLRRVANLFPDASLVMVGPLAKVDVQILPALPNIHWLGQRPYEHLPAIVKSFDVCLMPFALNDATRYINPTKTLEYMAAGKPIVSTAVPDVVHNFGSIVEIAASHEDFARAVWLAWAEPDARRIRQGIEKANMESWETIVRAMCGRIVESLLSKAPPATAI